jgi:hypothetical protein
MERDRPLAAADFEEDGPDPRKEEEAGKGLARSRAALSGRKDGGGAPPGSR